MLNYLVKTFTYQNLEKDLTRFAQIEYKRESPEYILHLIKTGQIYKN